MVNTLLSLAFSTAREITLFPNKSYYSSLIENTQKLPVSKVFLSETISDRNIMSIYCDKSYFFKAWVWSVYTSGFT